MHVTLLERMPEAYSACCNMRPVELPPPPTCAALVVLLQRVPNVVLVVEEAQRREAPEADGRASEPQWRHALVRMRGHAAGPLPPDGAYCWAPAWQATPPAGADDGAQQRRPRARRARHTQPRKHP
eukprot:1195323-Prorocentrum_minimum.AAC.6